ncbi:MAG: orotate phosphoribosyltransferase [Bacteroidota bacterium]|nr:orotate phosphoribosyltransferase [Bacteroidota bacterium]
MDISIQIANELLRIEAIKLRPDQPFKWSSGWNSPIYCDNRLTLSFPEVRTLIKSGLTAMVRSHFKGAEVIAGVATAGIPQGALVADEMKLPLVYVRPKPKDHGMENLIEGRISKGQKVVLVEDLISTGGSSLKAAEALKDAGAEILGMVAIFTYGFGVADDNFKKAGIPLFTLTNYSQLIQICEANKAFDAKAIASLNEWRKAPEAWLK